MKLVQNVITSFECILKLFNWSRLVDYSSSDGMNMFYTEYDFQVDLENLQVHLDISCRKWNTSLFKRLLQIHSLYKLIGKIKKNIV